MALASLNPWAIPFMLIPCLIESKTAALNMIRIVGQINLYLVIDTTGHLGCFLLPQDLQGIFLFIDTVRLLCVFRNVPSFADKLGVMNSAVSTVIPHISFGNSPFFSHFRKKHALAQKEPTKKPTVTKEIIIIMSGKTSDLNPGMIANTLFSRLLS